MHEAGIVHFDLNGRNILVRDVDGQPDDFVLIDFETARDDIALGYDLQKAVKGFICCSNHVNALHNWCFSNGIDPFGEWYYGWESD